ncbi:MAG: hypothetical protein AAF664_17955 [Planctomycetota bacterium]
MPVPRRFGDEQDDLIIALERYGTGVIAFSEFDEELFQELSRDVFAVGQVSPVSSHSPIHDVDHVNALCFSKD